MNFDTTFPLLRCIECNKPFDKASTLKRHGYYCRSKKSTATAIRNRSCIICAKAKQRCDQKKPECSRCTFKNLVCTYPTDRPRITASTQSERDAGTFSGLEVYSGSLQPSDSPADSTITFETASQYNNAANDGVHLDADQGSKVTELDPLDAELFQDGSMFAEIFGHQSDKNVMPDLSPNLAVPSLDIPATPSNLVRQIMRRPVPSIASQKAATLIFSTLKSYPFILINHDKPPPFIHHSSLHPEWEPDVSESLTNCLSLLRILKGNDSESGSAFHIPLQSNIKLFWKNVSWECERLCSETATHSPRELLAALQALSIYLLVRLSEGEKEYNNYDHLLIKTVTILSLELTTMTSSLQDGGTDSRSITESSSATDDSSDIPPSGKYWESFIFMESIRRLCLIYQVVNLLVYWTPAALCELPSDVVLAPLPSRKDLWAATSEREFNTEAKRGIGRKGEENLMFGMTTTGGLIKMNDYTLGDSHEMYGGFTEGNKPYMREAAWEEYCEGMDELGALVLLSSSLLG